MLVDQNEGPSEEVYLAYNYNRFQACRFGLEGQVLDSISGESVPLHMAVLKTLEQCRPYARELGALEALDQIERWVRAEGNDARWQREMKQGRRSLAELVLESAERWRGLSTLKVPEAWPGYA